jgi:high-affinity iron transporter
MDCFKGVTSPPGCPLERLSMFQSLVIMLREGVEAALIVGIVLAYLQKTGRRSLNRVVYSGLLAALAASVVAAYVFHRLEVAEEAYEGWLMLAGSAFVSTMVYWMWRTSKGLKKEIETRLSDLAGTPTRGAALGLFFFVFLMVLREGIETSLFLAAVSLRSSDLMNFTGGIIGLALAIGLGVAFFKGSIKINLRKFFNVTSLVLVVVAAQLFISGLHELSEGQILPSSRREMAMIGPIVNNEAFFFVVVVALCLFLVAAQKISSSTKADSDLAPLPAPERRKARAAERRERFWKTAVGLVGTLVIILISAEFIYSRTAQAMSPPERLSAVGGLVKIPTAQLADHKLHIYVLGENGVDVRLIAILDASGTVRAGLDACLICGNQGYYQDGQNVICRNCASAIYIPTIGQAGGCNPIHIDYVVEGDSVIFSEAALSGGMKYFR